MEKSIRDFVLDMAEEEAKKEFTPEQIAEAKAQWNADRNYTKDTDGWRTFNSAYYLGYLDGLKHDK